MSSELMTGGLGGSGLPKAPVASMGMMLEQTETCIR